MDDLISRQTAQRLFAKALTYQERVGRYKWVTAEVKQWIADFIEDLPSAQPEIIRCKDCIYCEPNTEKLDAWCNVWGNTTICEGYCFYGKRKND